MEYDTTNGGGAPPDAPPDWGAWLEAFGPRLMLYARQQTRCEADAEDVLQDAVLQLVRTVERGRFKGDVPQYPAFVLAAIRHRAMDVGRRRKTRLKYEQISKEQLTESTANPWLYSELDNDLYRRHVERILRRLPADQAEILLLKIWQELSLQEIAEITGAALSTVNSRYRRALTRFREELEQDPLPE